MAEQVGSQAKLYWRRRVLLSLTVDNAISIKQLVARLDLTTQSVTSHIKALETMGLVRSCPAVVKNNTWILTAEGLVEKKRLQALQND